MCCELCDNYFKCEEIEVESALCCGKCNEIPECNGQAIAGRHMMDDEEYDDLVDDEEEVEDELYGDYDDEDVGDLGEEYEYDNEEYLNESYSSAGSFTSRPLKAADREP